MIYLFFQTLFWLILAFLLGLILGWLLRGVICGPCSRDKEGATDSGAGAAGATSGQAVAASGSADAAASGVITDSMRPVGMDGPDGEADDLKRISGVGPVIEKTLNGLGIYHFRQIAAFSKDNTDWVDDHIDFPGRIEREKWVSQAAELAAGVETEFAQRYDRGEVGEDNPNT